MQQQLQPQKHDQQHVFLPQPDYFAGAFSPSPKKSPFDDDNGRASIALPPPTTARGHQRSRTTVDLPPLFTRLSFTPTLSSSSNSNNSHSPTKNSLASSSTLSLASSAAAASTFLQSLKPANIRPVSPERQSVITTDSTTSDSPESGPFSSTLSLDSLAAHKRKATAAVGKLTSWFEGASEPVHISLLPPPRKEKSEAEDTQVDDPDQVIAYDSMDRFTRLPPKKQGLAGLSASIGPSLNFLRKPLQPPLKTGSDEGDYLANIDIREVLFPAGHPDETSPAAFKNLQLNAEGLLRRFQVAHVEQVNVAKNATTKTRNQADDLEAAQMRNEHLKLQLEEMAERAAEQERLLSSLRSELAASKPSTEAQRSIRKVSAESMHLDRCGTVIHHQRFARNKRSSLESQSDAGSDISSVVSIFSDAASDGAGESPGTSIAPSPMMKHTRLHYPVIEHDLNLAEVAIVSVQECQRCYDMEPSEAWDVVGMLKVESVALKDRIAELERANDDALDFLRGLNLS